MKREFIKGAALLTVGLAIVGCSSHEDDLYNPNQLKEDTQANFRSTIMGGQSIDANQTWNTAEKVDLTITTEMEGTLKIYTTNPMGETAASPLATKSLAKGTSTLTVAKPSDASTLFAALFKNDGSISVMQITDNAATFKAPTAVAGARSLTRAPQAPTQEAWDFADAPDDEAFASAMPTTNIYPASDYYKYGGAYPSVRAGYYMADQETTQDINFWMGNADIYLTGKKSLNFINPGDGTPTVTFYVLPGADVTFTSNFNYQKPTGLAIYISAGAKVTFEGDMSSNIYMYNRGEVVINGVTGPYADGLMYNEGTITSKKNLAVFNNNSQVINAGTWTVAEGCTVEGSGHVLNLGTMTITGLTLVNSNFCTWVNDGTWTTDNYTYNAGSTDVINNCRLIVNNLFTINLGDTDKNCFAINAGGGVTTKDLHFAGPGYIKMAANSLFTVTNEAKMDATKADYGFWGPTTGDSYAVLKAKDIVTTNEQQGYDITYGGNLYVACDTHFPNGWSGQYPIIDFIGNAKLVAGQTNAPYTIPSTGNCNGGYNGGDGSRIDNEPIMYYYYAFEDLGNTNDIDFNDVVLRVSAPDEGRCDVQLCAAGGILKTKILYNGNVICEDVHTTMGGTMKNTSGSVKASTFKNIGELNNITDASDLPFAIEVTNESTQTSVTVEAVGLGEPPLMIKVAGIAEGEHAGKWFWAKERINIKDAYGQFVGWAHDRTTNTDWYKNITNNGNIVKY